MGGGPFFLRERIFFSLSLLFKKNLFRGIRFNGVNETMANLPGVRRISLLLLKFCFCFSFWVWRRIRFIDCSEVKGISSYDGRIFPKKFSGEKDSLLSVGLREHLSLGLENFYFFRKKTNKLGFVERNYKGHWF